MEKIYFFDNVRHLVLRAITIRDIEVWEEVNVNYINMEGRFK